MTTPTDDLRARAGRFVAAVHKSVEHRPGERSALRRSLGRHPEDTAIRPAARRVLAPHLRDLPHHRREAVERAFYAVAALIAAQPRSARDEAAADDEPDLLSGDDTGTSVPPGPGDDVQPEGAVATARTPAPERAPGFDLGSALGRSAVEGARARRAHRTDPPDTDDTASGDTAPHRDAPQEKRLHLLCRQDLDGLHRHLPRVVRFLRSDRISVDWARLACDLALWGEGGPQGRNRVAKQWLDGYYRTVSIEQGRQRREQNDAPAPGE
ncbi:type I-E CRISPR-associated protein Cse2/CasB [Nocardiopsis trehalosi]|uniref:type I-E CRISPR-associated protein Cse2/CasB n=1 Tax=Nocardiopsis trehalosi TaxID=109329 RepID=UPI00083148D8|nr:type I-E CRISPR-associated protein Cse2/CasB [Nocardiopsis trehalosi]